MNYNFKLLDITKKTNDFIYKLLINFPKSEKNLKGVIEKNMYEMIELIFSFRFSEKERVKEKYLKDLLVKQALIDYYIGIGYERKYLSKDKFQKVCNFIIELRKITYGLLNNKTGDKYES